MFTRKRMEKGLKGGSRRIIFAMSPANFTVEVVVENKPLARDPEGETIHHNLILKGGYSQVMSVRAGKLLRMKVEARSPEDAKQLVQKLCEDLRIYNPAAHICQVRVTS
jgi:phosphoribosylformylglycinamidine synthase subunit PurS